MSWIATALHHSPFGSGEGSLKHAPRGPIKARDHTDAADHKDAPQCTATAKGSRQRCKRRPIPGGTVCKKHGGGAPQVQAAAARRLADLIPKAVEYYDWLLSQKDYPSAGLGAANAVWDREKGKPHESMSVEVSGDQALIAALMAGRRRAATSQKDEQKCESSSAGDHA